MAIKFQQIADFGKNQQKEIADFGKSSIFAHVIH